MMKIRADKAQRYASTITEITREKSLDGVIERLINHYNSIDASTNSYMLAAVAANIVNDNAEAQRAVCVVGDQVARASLVHSAPLPPAFNVSCRRTTFVTGDVTKRVYQATAVHVDFVVHARLVVLVDDGSVKLTLTTAPIDGNGSLNVYAVHEVIDALALAGLLGLTRQRQADFAAVAELVNSNSAAYCVDSTRLDRLTGFNTRATPFTYAGRTLTAKVSPWRSVVVLDTNNAVVGDKLTIYVGRHYAAVDARVLVNGRHANLSEVADGVVLVDGEYVVTDDVYVDGQYLVINDDKIFTVVNDRWVLIPESSELRRPALRTAIDRREAVAALLG